MNQCSSIHLHQHRQKLFNKALAIGTCTVSSGDVLLMLQVADSAQFITERA